MSLRVIPKRLDEGLIRTMGDFRTELHSGFIALVGPANAGKSTLINAILKQKVSIVSPKPQTTRNRVLGIKDGENYQMVFLDTPGLFDERKVGKTRGKALGEYLKEEVREALSGIDIVVLVLDGSRLLRERKHFDEVVETFKDEFEVTPKIIAINKIDLVNKVELLPLLKELYDKLSVQSSSALEIIPISAKADDGLGQLEQIILKLLPRGVAYFPEGQVTDQSDERLTAEIIREKLFLQLSDELPYSIAVRIESWEETDKQVDISAVISVERDSQKGIVIGAKGAMLKSIGTAARKELERVFGTKVFLKLFVRVEEHWSKTEKGLRKVGMR